MIIKILSFRKVKQLKFDLKINIKKVKNNSFSVIYEWLFFELKHASDRLSLSVDS